MKRTLALTVVTALCAVSPFVAGAAMSSLQQPGADAPATSYDGAQAEYILRDYEGYVSVFASDADRIDAIASFFPFIFFLVAALVALTTMTRMVEEERMLIGTFKALGYSMNTSDPDEINAAYEWLLQMNDTMSPVYVTDEVIDGMMNGYKDLAVVYSGDATVILDENEDMSFYMPEQGTNIWCDAMVIPANAENPLLAHEFINYMLTYEAAFDNTETVGYTSPNAEVFEEMTSSEDLYAENAAYLPRSGYEKDEMFHDNQTLMRELSKLWIKVKAAK